MLSEVDLTKICCFAFDLIETALELNQTRDYDIFASLGGQKNFSERYLFTHLLVI